MVFADDTEQKCLQIIGRTPIDTRSMFVMTWVRNELVVVNVCLFVVHEVVPVWVDRTPAQILEDTKLDDRRAPGHILRCLNPTEYESTSMHDTGR